MLLSGDIKSLEVVTAAYLSQDQVLCEEVRQGTDFHALNQQRFGLPNRTIAKIFVFKLIYGATAYGYANDGDFVGVSTSQKFWQEVIDEYYKKYKGVREWHSKLVQDALHVGKFTSPSGRQYVYPSQDVATRLWFWRPKILNYPVQGLGADLVMLARISLWKRLVDYPQVLPVSSVHDSLVLDMPENMCYNISVLVKKVVSDVPSNFERCFGQPFDLPLACECKVGPNLGQMISCP